MQLSKWKSVNIWRLSDICKFGGFWQFPLYVPEMTSLHILATNNYIDNHYSDCGKSCPSQFRLQNKKICDSFDTASFQRQPKNQFSKTAKNYLYYYILYELQNHKGCNDCSSNSDFTFFLNLTTKLMNP